MIDFTPSNHVLIGSQHGRDGTITHAVDPAKRRSGVALCGATVSWTAWICLDMDRGTARLCERPECAAVLNGPGALGQGRLC